MRRLILLALIPALAAFTACDDDNGDDADGASVEAYCALSAGLNEGTDLPSQAEWEALRAAAPDDIADEVRTASEAIEERGEDAYSDPDVLAAVEDIEAYERANCDVEADAPEGDGDIDVDVNVEDGDTDTTDGSDSDTDTTDTTEDSATTTTEPTATTVPGPTTTR